MAAWISAFILWWVAIASSATALASSDSATASSRSEVSWTMVRSKPMTSLRSQNFLVGSSLLAKPPGTSTLPTTEGSGYQNRTHARGLDGATYGIVSERSGPERKMWSAISALSASS